MIKIIIAVIAAMFFMSPTNATAWEDGGYICDGCSDAEYRTLVKSKTAVSRTSYVFDTVRWKVTKWYVEVVREDGFTVKIATQLNIENSVVESFGKYRSMTEDLLINAGNGVIQVPESSFGSAFEVVGNVEAYGTIYDWLYFTSDWPGWTTNFVVMAVFDLTNKVSSLVSVIYLQFADGSKMTLKMDHFDVYNLSFLLEYEYAEDGNGNVIPNSLPNYSPSEPVGPHVRDYIWNNGAVIRDTWGEPFEGAWGPQCTYGVSCSLDGEVCTVTEYCS